MKVYYESPSILEAVDNVVRDALQPINFILLTQKEWDEVIACGKKYGFRNQSLLYMSASHIEYRGTTLIKEKE